VPLAPGAGGAGGGGKNLTYGGHVGFNFPNPPVTPCPEWNCRRHAGNRPLLIIKKGKNFFKPFGLFVIVGVGVGGG